MRSFVSLRCGDYRHGPDELARVTVARWGLARFDPSPRCYRPQGAVNGNKGERMGVAELAKVVGASGILTVEVGSGVAWQVPCRVVDARVSWGEVQYQVTSADGQAERVWVKAFRVADLVTA